MVGDDLCNLMSYLTWYFTIKYWELIIYQNGTICSWPVIIRGNIFMADQKKKQNYFSYFQHLFICNFDYIYILFPKLMLIPGVTGVYD